MAESAKEIFKGFIISILPDPEVWSGLKRHLQERVTASGGKLCCWAEDDIKDECTHVVANNHQEQHAIWAKNNGKKVVTLLWLWDCLRSGRCLPVAKEKLYSGELQPPRCIPAAQTEFHVSMTGFQDFSKIVYGRMIQALGLTFNKDMDPYQTRCLIAADLDDSSSRKISAARQPREDGGIDVINVLWVYDSLRRGKVLPTDAYKTNPPADVDPCKGGLAINAALQVIAESDTSPTPSPATSDRSNSKGTASADSYADISQQVANADDAVQRLVDQLSPIAEADDRPAPPPKAITPRAAAAVDDDETDDDLQQEEFGGPPCLARRGPAPRAETGGGTKGGRGQTKSKIPVNVNAPCADQKSPQTSEDELCLGSEETCVWKAPLRKPGRPSRGGKLSSRGGAPPKKLGERGTKRKAEEEPLVGREIKKLFQQGTFKGKVMSFDPKTEYYNVAYEDNDSEELSLSELRPLLIPGGGTEAVSHTPPKGTALGDVTTSGRREKADDRAGKAQENASKPAKRPAAQTAARSRHVRPALIKAAQAGIENVDEKRGASACQAPSAKRQKRTPPETGKEPVRQCLFAVSGMHSEQRREVEAALSARRIATSNLQSHQWDKRVTHLLLPKSWIRCSKVLAAMASGAWLLSDSFLTACERAESLVAEDSHEIKSNKKNTISNGCPKHWRVRRQAMGRAFEPLKVTLFGDFEVGTRPTREEVLSILEAGGARILTVNQALSMGAHFVVTKASRPPSDYRIKQLTGAGLCIVSPAFVVDWIAHPFAPLPKKHLLFGSRMGSDLTAAVKARSLLELGSD